MIPTALGGKTQADNQEKRQGKGGKETEADRQVTKSGNRDRQDPETGL
jgi:hypothetical protein